MRIVLSRLYQLVACSLRLPAGKAGLAAALILISLSTSSRAHPGIGIVMDSRSNIYYTDLKDVWKIDPTGKKSIAVHDVHTHELYMDENDNLFGEHLWYNGEAADTWGHYVWKLSCTGQLTKVIPDTDGFREGFSFVRDHVGRTYSAHGPAGCQHIMRTNSDNTTSVIGDQCLKNIRWMTAAESGHLYLIDGGHVKQVDPSGHISTLAPDVPTPKMTQFFVNKNHYLGGITVDKDQNVYVCDFSARNVKRISRDGKISVVVETTLPWSPSGLLVDDERNELWVLEASVTNAVRVERIDRHGNRRVF